MEDNEIKETVEETTDDAQDAVEVATETATENATPAFDAAAAIGALSEKLDSVIEYVSGIAEKLAGLSSMVVDSGGEFVETDVADNDPSEPDIVEVPDISDLDLDM